MVKNNLFSFNPDYCFITFLTLTNKECSDMKIFTKDFISNIDNLKLQNQPSNFDTQNVVD